MPKLWTDTVDAHRAEVRDAILDAMAALVVEHGLTAVSMSLVAERTEITRATLYKYFPDLRAIIDAWHERQVSNNLDALVAARNTSSDPDVAVEHMLDLYARMVHEQHSSELIALLHDDEHSTRAYQRFTALLREAISRAAERGLMRTDASPEELASYCVHALAAANRMPSMAAVRRLVGVTMSGLRPVRAPRRKR